jgi:hypothetical protein
VKNFRERRLLGQEVLMSRLLLMSLAATAACTGGHINAELTLPRPGGVTQGSNGSMTMAPGIVVEAKDKSGVCERIRIRVYTAATAPANVNSAPAGVKPIAEGRAIGSYSADSPRCSALAANLAPRDDYWMIVEYPGYSPDDPASTYYTFGKAALQAPPSMTSGFYPVKVVDKQTTKLAATFAPPGTPVISPPQ